MSLSGSGSINTTVDLPVGASATFTVAATVSATTGAVVNTARIDAPAGVSDPNPADNAATDTTSITPTGDLSITKTDGLTTIAAGQVRDLHDRCHQRGTVTDRRSSSARHDPGGPAGRDVDLLRVCRFVVQ